MKSNFFRLIFFLYFFINIPKIYSNSFQKKKNHIKNIRLLDEADKFSTSTNTIENNDGFVSETTFMTENPVTNSTPTGTGGKSSSSGLSAGLIIAIVIPSVVVIMGLVFLAIAFSRSKSSPSNPNLPNKTIDISSSEINKEENTGQINPEIKGNDSTVKV